jgi:HEAT repeat protein
MHIPDYNDFLIYMMRTAGETVKHQVRAGSSGSGMTTVPVALLEANPCLNFIVEHIKESEREYLLRREIQNYKKFFDWLAGKKVETSYIEKPRSRAIESALKKNTIIIQWDINLNKKFKEQYHAYRGSQRLIIDPTSPIHSVIQPFDYTLCIPQMKKLNNGTRVTYPQQILLPDQVVKLVLQGVPIISNVLRWDVISKFVNEGYLSGGEVLASIAHSDKMKFVYGSFELAKALDEMVELGKAGLTDVQYDDYKKRLKQESKRVTVAVREICREFIQSEGKPLEEILEMLNQNEEAKLRMVAEGIKTSKSIAIFRKHIVRVVTKAYFRNNVLENKFFKQIESLQQSHYGVAMDVVADQLSVYYIDLENILLRERPTKAQSFANPLGKILMGKLQFPNVGDFTDLEKFELYLNLVKVRTFFVEEEKRRLDPKAQKQYLTELIYQSEEGDFPNRVRIITQICLFKNNRALDFLRDLLTDKDRKIRDVAFIALKHRKDSKLKLHLKDLLDHEFEPVRESAIKNMIKLPHGEIFDYLLIALENESTIVRSIAFDTLAQIKHGPTVKLIGQARKEKIFKSFVTCLKDTDENIRNKAVDNIVKEPFEQIKDILFGSLDNESPHVRNVACNILHLKGDDKLKKKTLMKVYNDEYLTIKQFALENIALRKYAESPKIVENNISGVITQFRRDYVKFLIKNDIPKQNLTNKTIEKIIEYFVHDNIEFNKEISDTLKKYGDDSVHFLTKALNETKYKHKESIARFLEYLNTKKSVEQIIKLKNHKDSNLRIFNLDYLVRNQIVDSFIPIVERALTDSVPDVAYRAVQIYMGENIAFKNYSEDFVPAALKSYTAKNMSFDDLIMDRLCKLGNQVIDNLDIILESDSTGTKLSVIKLLVNISSKRSADKIVELLDHKDELIKREAYDYIIWVDHPKARSFINKALKEKDEEIRRKAIQKFLDKKIAKANITENLIKAMVTTPMHNVDYADLVTHTLLKVPNKALPIIKSVFKSQEVGMKNFVLGSVGMFDTPEAKEFISSLMKDKDPLVRLFCLNYTRQNNKKKLKEVLEKAVDDKDSKVREVALRSLTENIPLESYSEKLIKMLVENFLKKNDLPSSRAQNALRKIGKKAIPYLIDGLKSGELNVVRYSAEILGEIQAKEATDLLIPMLTNDEVKIRRSAAYALRKTKDVKAMKVMLDGLNDNDLYVRRSIIKGLGAMNCTEAKPILKKMKKDESKRKNPDKITISMIDEALAQIK